MDLFTVKPVAGYENHVRILNFLVRLNLFALPLYTILALDITLPQLQYITAKATFSLLNIAGLNPTISDLLISIPIKNGTWGAFINWDCTAWKSMLAFFALVMATDRVCRQERHAIGTKMKGLAIFLPLIFAVNLLRIFFMFVYVNVFDIAHYQLVHAVVWSWGMIFVIAAFWVIWIRKVN